MTDPGLADSCSCISELASVSWLSSVSPERSLPVSGEGFSGLHALPGHLWRHLGRARFTYPRLAVAAPRTTSPVREKPRSFGS